MIQIEPILFLAFGIAFFLGLGLVGVGVWKLWRRIERARNRNYTDR